MSVFKYHAFIYFMRPPSWYGTRMYPVDCHCAWVKTGRQWGRLRVNRLNFSILMTYTVVITWSYDTWAWGPGRVWPAAPRPPGSPPPGIRSWFGTAYTHIVLKLLNKKKSIFLLFYSLTDCRQPDYFYNFFHISFAQQHGWNFAHLKF